MDQLGAVAPSCLLVMPGLIDLVWAKTACHKLLTEAELRLSLVLAVLLVKAD